MPFSGVKPRRDQNKIGLVHLQQWNHQNTPRGQIFSVAHDITTEWNVDGVAFSRIDSNVSDRTRAREKVTIVVSME